MQTATRETRSTWRKHSRPSGTSVRVTPSHLSTIVARKNFSPKFRVTTFLSNAFLIVVFAIRNRIQLAQNKGST